MTTVVLKLPVALAKGLSRAADVLHMTNEQAAVESVRLFVRSVAPTAAAMRKRRRRRV